jgi:hypothetical protein
MTRSNAENTTNPGSISRTSSFASLNSGTTFRPADALSSTQTSASPSTSSVTKSIKEKLASIVCVLLGGEKGAGLPSLGEVVVKGRKVRMIGGFEKSTDTSKGRKGKGEKEKENPVARLKLLLVSVLCFVFGVGC